MDIPPSQTLGVTTPRSANMLKLALRTTGIQPLATPMFVEDWKCCWLPRRTV